ncbi:MAG TPA: hypothetical protein VK203_03580 [Nostocaceae cyanobacterium]|nr:hypothetical protein [Nostocaceae cyanobacterium]
MFKKLILAGIVVIILWSGFLAKSASSQQTDFRIFNLESDLRRLELRLNQLEYSLGQNRASPSPNINLTPQQSTGSSRKLSQSERDRMFDRLATLVVELKQQVNQLNARVAKLESR